MALPAGTADFPLGFESITLNLIAYKVDAVDCPSELTRTIERTDEFGDAADYQVRLAGEHATGTITLQRATDSTVLPSAGESGTYDFDRSGTTSTITITDVKVVRSKDAADVFECGFLVDTYQG